MKTINIIEFKNSGLHLDHEQLSTIELEDSAFDYGSFGEIYICLSINNKRNNDHPPQVVKVFIDDDSSVITNNYQTILKFQDKIQSFDDSKPQGKRSIKHIPGAFALPQLSFRGMLQGKEVMGYTTNYLSQRAFLHYDNLVNHHSESSVPSYLKKFKMKNRLRFGFELAEAMWLFDQLEFVHADINPQNIFLGKKNGNLAIIDFESGAIRPESPTTFGKPGIWKAPEMQKEQQKQYSDFRYADLWSLGTLIHHLLFLRSPLYFLARLDSRYLRRYLKISQWPALPEPSDSTVFNSANVKIHPKYLKKLAEMNPRIVKGFSRMINTGGLKPSKRPDARFWSDTLGDLVFKPVIHHFKADIKTRKTNDPVTLRWETSDTYRLSIEPEIGDVSAEGQVKVFPSQETVYRLSATDYNGQAVYKTLTIQVKFRKAIIKYFSATVSNLPVGQFTTLMWHVSHSEKVRISPDIGEVDPQGLMVLNPTRSITYELEACNEMGQRTTATCNIKVIQKMQRTPFAKDGKAGIKLPVKQPPFHKVKSKIPNVQFKPTITKL